MKILNPQTIHLSIQLWCSDNRGHLCAGGPPANRPYGHLWWISKVPGTEVPSFFAVGFGGQYIYVVPTWELVVVATSEVVDATNDNTGPILARHVLPAVRP